MKSLFALLTIGILVSCGDPNVKDLKERIVIDPGKGDMKIYEWIYKSHLYLVVSGSDNNFSVVHAGHCICRGRK